MLFEKNRIQNKTMSFPPRSVSVLVLIQVFIVAAGLLLTRGFRKLYEKTLGEVAGDKLLPPFSDLVMTWGWLLLLIPVGWALWCLREKPENNPNSEVRSVDFWIGMSLLGGLFWISSFSVLAHVNALHARSF